jgi:hypothetical protein
MYHSHGETSTPTHTLSKAQVEVKTRTELKSATQSADASPSASPKPIIRRPKLVDFNALNVKPPGLASVVNGGPSKESTSETESMNKVPPPGFEVPAEEPVPSVPLSPSFLDQFGLKDMFAAASFPKATKSSTSLAGQRQESTKPTTAALQTNSGTIKKLSAQMNSPPVSTARNSRSQFESTSRPACGSGPQPSKAPKEVLDDCFDSDFLEPTEKLPGKSLSEPLNHEFAPFVVTNDRIVKNYDSVKKQRKLLEDYTDDLKVAESEMRSKWIEQIRSDLWIAFDCLQSLYESFPNGFTPREFTSYELELSMSSKHGMFHWAATSEIYTLHRFLQLKMIYVKDGRFHVNEAATNVTLLRLPKNLCSNFYRCLRQKNGSITVSQALLSLPTLDHPASKPGWEDLLHLCNHFPRVFLLQCDATRDFHMATIRLNPYLPEWRVVLDNETQDGILSNPYCKNSKCQP